MLSGVRDNLEFNIVALLCKQARKQTSLVQVLKFEYWINDPKFILLGLQVYTKVVIKIRKETQLLLFFDITSATVAPARSCNSFKRHALLPIPTLQKQQFTIKSQGSSTAWYCIASGNPLAI